MHSFVFLTTSVLLGLALAMDSFSVSVADGLANPLITRKQKMVIPFVFGFFQFIMPVVGWLCVHTIAKAFSLFEKAVPWIGFGLLCWIGREMILSRNKPIEAVQRDFYTPATLITQGIGTAIDALSVGFAIEEYAFNEAFVCASVIGIVTFVLCVLGIELGRMIGKHLYSGASVTGGLILIAIGIKILVEGVFSK